MPVGGRINRRDNLRDKVASKKEKISTENSQSPKSNKEKIPGLKSLALLKEKNADKKLQSKINKNIVVEETKVDDNFIKVASEATDVRKGKLQRKNSKLPTKVQTIICSDVSDKSEVKVVEDMVIDEVSPPVSTNSSPQRKSRRNTTSFSKIVTDNVPKLTKSTPVKGRVTRMVENIEKMEVVNEEEPTVKRSSRKTTRDLPVAVVLLDEIKEVPVTDIQVDVIDVPKQRGRKQRLLVAEEEETRVSGVVDMDVDNFSEGFKEKDSILKDAISLKKLGRRKNISMVHVANDKDTSLVKEKEKSPETKIPGLVYLQNLKSRKSLVASSVLSTNTIDTKHRKSQVVADTRACKTNENGSEIIPGLSTTAEIRRRKSVLEAADVGEEKTMMELDLNPDVNELKKRKVVVETKPLKTLPVISKPLKKSPTKIKQVMESSKIPGLSTTAELKRRKSAIESTEIVVEAPPCKVIVENVSLKTPQKSSSTKPKTVLESPKIPGFSLIEEIRNRKSLVASAKEEEKKKKAETTTIPPLTTSISTLPMNTLLRTSVTSSLPATPLQNPVTSSLSATPLRTPVTSSVPYSSVTPKLSNQRQPLYLPSNSCSNSGIEESHQTPVRPIHSSVSGILARTPLHQGSPSILKTSASCLKVAMDSPATPSTNVKPASMKRPMSCLSDETESCNEPRGKMARTSEVPAQNMSASRRQSVTFNNRVEVKEIKGNSFNSSDNGGDRSEDDEEDEEAKAEEYAALAKKMEEQIAKTKRSIVSKRMSESTGNIFSQNQRFQPSTPTSLSSSISCVTSKPSSALSEYMLAKKKTQFDFGGGVTSTTSRLTTFSREPTTKTISSSSSSKAFSYDRVQRHQTKVDDNLSNEISGDEGEDEEQKKTTCVIS